MLEHSVLTHNTRCDLAQLAARRLLAESKEHKRNAMLSVCLEYLERCASRDMDGIIPAFGSLLSARI